jgi:FO synthase
MAAAAGRPARQRTTTYGTVGAERTAAARRSVGLEPVGVGPARARG